VNRYRVDGDREQAWNSVVDAFTAASNDDDAPELVLPESNE